jgi:hypothetical protein
MICGKIRNHARRMGKMRTDMNDQRAKLYRHDAKHPRTDFRTRDVVNQAIASIPSVGLQRAAEFLSAMNVPAEVAIRTLVYPHRRRA